jgi:hypothetical protein
MNMNSVFLNRLLKYLELGVLSLAFAAFAFTFYANMTCARDVENVFCGLFGADKTISSLSLQILLPLFAVLNSLRILNVYTINQLKFKNDTLFKAGLIGLTITYIGYSVYRSAAQNIFASGANLIKLLLYGILGSTLVIFFIESEIWGKKNSFIRVRVFITSLHLLVYIFNSNLGILVGLVLIPILALIPDGIHKNGGKIDLVHSSN